MARVLIVFFRAPSMQWRLTYDSHLYSFQRYTEHECYYLNAYRSSVPRYVRDLRPDVVIFHYTFLTRRQHPDEFLALASRLDFIRDWSCRKALVPHDEQSHSDLLAWFANAFRVTHIFSPAPDTEIPRIYKGLDLDSVLVHPVLTGYIDESSVRATSKSAVDLDNRSIDIGYRSWGMWPFYGRHGLLKQELGRRFEDSARDLGLTTDISGDARDALLGDEWLQFLAQCKYTIGVEGGSSILDWDGSIADCTFAYLADHPDATFEEVEARCFPGRDGQFHYFLFSPRHFEAVMTRTCQILVEGSYGGVLVAGRHFIELKRDFSNIQTVLDLVVEDRVRRKLVDDAYADVVLSGHYSYRTFANSLVATCLNEPRSTTPVERRNALLLLLNRADEAVSMVAARIEYANLVGRREARRGVRRIASSLLGERRLRKLLTHIRGNTS